MAGGLLLLNTGLVMMKTSPSAAVLPAESCFTKAVSTVVIPIAIPPTTGAGTMVYP